MEDINNQVFIACLAVLAGTYWHTDKSLVLLMLAAIFLACINLAWRDNPFTLGVNFVYTLFCFEYPFMALALPVILYFECRYPVPRIWICACLSFPMLSLITGGRYGLLVWVCILSVLAVMLSIRQRRMEQMAKVIVSMRDDEVEFRMAIKNKNKELLKAQDDEIYMATLRERNRIAREIHDNVGHLLSRSILQVGALLAVNKEQTVDSMLMGVRDTLDDAMINIRNSVHDLHHDSVDLKKTILETIQCLNDFEVNFSYDISPDIDRELKYMFIAIMKECTNNIVKHSNGKHVCIKLIEHPGFYQMVVEDDGNGCCPERLSLSHGIGLENIRQRIEQVQGIVKFQCENGFKVFISIQK